MIEIGNKWVDLLLGETNLFFVLFNFQYFLFNLIVTLKNWQDFKDYFSITLVCLGVIFTLCAVVGLVFKP